MQIISKIPNTSIIVIDPTKSLLVTKQNNINYYTDSIPKILDGITKQIEQMNTNKSNQKGVIIIYGLDKAISKIEDTTIIESFMSTLKKYEKISVIIVEDANKIKKYNYESWFTNYFDIDNGIWIGRGVSDQSLFRVSTYTKEMQDDIKNDRGYYITESFATPIKLIDFISKEEDYEE